jgi:hypothetical protein
MQPRGFFVAALGSRFSMMVAALPFVGAGANGTQLFNTTNRLVPTFGVNRRTFWWGSSPFDSIRGEGFLRRRFTSYLDPLLAVPIYSSFFWKVLSWSLSTWPVSLMPEDAQEFVRM